MPDEKNIDADKVLEQIVFFPDVSAMNNVERDKCRDKGGVNDDVVMDETYVRKD